MKKITLRGNKIIHFEAKLVALCISFHQQQYNSFDLSHIRLLLDIEAVTECVCAQRDSRSIARYRRPRHTRAETRYNIPEYNTPRPLPLFWTVRALPLRRKNHVYTNKCVRGSLHTGFRDTYNIISRRGARPTFRTSFFAVFLLWLYAISVCISIAERVCLLLLLKLCGFIIYILWWCVRRFSDLIARYTFIVTLHRVAALLSGWNFSFDVFIVFSFRIGEISDADICRVPLRCGVQRVTL